MTARAVLARLAHEAGRLGSAPRGPGGLMESFMALDRLVRKWTLTRLEHR
jgi:hypothetical protein